MYSRHQQQSAKRNWFKWIGYFEVNDCEFQCFQKKTNASIYMWYKEISISIIHFFQIDKKGENMKVCDK